MVNLGYMNIWLSFLFYFEISLTLSIGILYVYPSARMQENFGGRRLCMQQKVKKKFRIPKIY